MKTREECEVYQKFGSKECHICPWECDDGGCLWISKSKTHYNQNLAASEKK